MVLEGHGLLSHALDLVGDVRERIEKIDGMHVNDRDDFCGPGRATEFDPLPVIIDISALGTNGYRAADWLRARHRIDMHLVDHRRISAQFTHADDEDTAGRLLEGLRDLSRRSTARSARGPPSTCPARTNCARTRCVCPGTPTSPPPRTFRPSRLWDGSPRR